MADGGHTPEDAISTPTPTREVSASEPKPTITRKGFIGTAVAGTLAFLGLHKLGEAGRTSHDKAAQNATPIAPDATFAVSTPEDAIQHSKDYRQNPQIDLAEPRSTAAPTITPQQPGNSAQLGAVERSNLPAQITPRVEASHTPGQENWAPSRQVDMAQRALASQVQPTPAGTPRVEGTSTPINLEPKPVATTVKK